MQEMETKVSAAPHKEQTCTRVSMASKTCRKAGYLTLTDSTFDVNKSSVSGREMTDEAHTYVLLDEETQAGEVRRSPFRRALLCLERQVLKLFRRRRPPHVPAGLQCSSSDSVSILSDRVMADPHVYTDLGPGDDESQIVSSANDRPRSSSRFVNALAVEENHCRSLSTRSDDGVGISRGSGSQSAVSSEEASDNRLHFSSTDRFDYALQLPKEDERQIPKFFSETNSSRILEAFAHVRKQPLETQTSEVPPEVPPRRSVPLSTIHPLPVAPVTPVSNQMVHTRRQTVYDSPRPTWSGQDPMNCKEMMRNGWYWGPMKREDAVKKLFGHPPGTFLVRDCSDERHLYALSFVAPNQVVKHSLIQYCRGRWSFYNTMVRSEKSVVHLIEKSVSRASLGLPTLTWEQGVTALTKPLSRFNTVKPLQHHCRFAIRQHCRIDLVQQLPLPARLKEYLKEDIM